jgi:myo-inositol 2-dehydrogenase/D-chiro-inositol 1-dehydrogenase
VQSNAEKSSKGMERIVTVRIGILGAGYMGKTHGRILRGDPRVVLSAVFDVDAQRRQEAARELECRAAESEEQLMDQVDAVYVTVPNAMHAAASARALERGKHVFCEKPFATSLGDAGKLLELCRSTKSVFVVGHNRRFAPAYMLVKEFLAEGRHEPTLAQFKMNRGELESPPWVENTALTGGFLYETPLHLLDMARWLLGEVTDLTAAGAADLCGAGQFFFAPAL